MNKTKNRKSLLWTMFLMPMVVIACIAGVAVFVAMGYIDDVKNEWLNVPQIALKEVDEETVVSILQQQCSTNNLTELQSAGLIGAVLAWVDSQKRGGKESFMAFRYSGLSPDNFQVASGLDSYYLQFFGGGAETQSNTTTVVETPDGLMDKLFNSKQSGNQLTFNKNRLCLGCLESLSLETLRVKVAPAATNPMNAFLAEGRHLSQSTFPGFVAPSKLFHREIVDLGIKAQTANVGAIVSTGSDPDKTFRLGIQFLWIPNHKTWLPVELAIAYPGKRLPREVFLF